LELNQIDANEPNIFDEQPMPDNMQLSSNKLDLAQRALEYNLHLIVLPKKALYFYFSLGKLKLCLQENEFDHTYFGDFIKLFDQSLTSVGLENWPEAKR
jgi:hypothetical protein